MRFDSPLSPPRINRNPRGLLGFFGIKNGGHNPEELAPQLSPSVEMFDWYLQTNREYMRTSINIAALNFTLYYTVPVGECWYVERCSFITSVLGAGQTLETVPCLQDASGLRQLTLCPMPGSRTVGAVYAVEAGGFFMNSGDSLGLYTTQLAGGPIVAPIYTMAYCRLTD